MSDSVSRASIKVWGWTLSIFMVLTYLICIGYGLVVPSSVHMHQVWAPLLPGFEWLTLQGFLAGAVGSFLYGWYGAVILVPLYNFFSRRNS